MSSPNLRQRQKAATRAALVAAARDVFSAKGYGGASIDDVAAAAGTSRATVYLHFAGKGELVAAVIDDLKAGAAAWAGPVRPGRRRRTDVEELARAWIAFYRANVDGFRVWHEASALEPGVDPPVRAAGSVVVEQLLGAPLPAASVRGEVAVAVAFMGVERLLYGWLVQGWDLDEEAVVAEVTDLWHGWFLPRLRRELGDR